MIEQAEDVLRDLGFASAASGIMGTRIPSRGSRSVVTRWRARSTRR